jgi:hypothetical protein
VKRDDCYDWVANPVDCLYAVQMRVSDFDCIRFAIISALRAQLYLLKLRLLFLPRCSHRASVW